MSIDRETLMAYADGELDEATRRRVEMAMETDPDLVRQLEAERALRSALQEHFAPLAETPVPGQWTDMILHSTRKESGADDRKVVSLGAMRMLRGRGAYWGAGLAIAASLAIGVLVGTQIAGQGMMVDRNGTLIASASLADALDTRLAVAQNAAGPRILVSFQTEAGQYCRAFADSSFSGIACKAGDVWEMERVLKGSTEQQSDYRQAGSVEMELMSAAQNMAMGEPLDAQGEAEARSKGWR